MSFDEMYVLCITLHSKWWKFDVNITKHHTKCDYCSGENIKSVLRRRFRVHTRERIMHLQITKAAIQYFWSARLGNIYLARRSRRLWIPFSDSLATSMRREDPHMHKILWHFGEAVATKRSATRRDSPGSPPARVYSKYKWSIIFDVTAPFKAKKRKPLYWWALVIPRVNIVSHARSLATPAIGQISVCLYAFKCINVLCVAFGTADDGKLFDTHTQEHTLLYIYGYSIAFDDLIIHKMLFDLMEYWLIDWLMTPERHCCIHYANYTRFPSMKLKRTIHYSVNSHFVVELRMEICICPSDNIIYSIFSADVI